MTPIEFGEQVVMPHVANATAGWARQLRPRRGSDGQRWRPRGRRVVRLEIAALVFHTAQAAIGRGDDASPVAETGIRVGVSNGFRATWLAANQRHAAYLVEATAGYAAAGDVAARFLTAAAKGQRGEGTTEVAQLIGQLCSTLADDVAQLLSQAIANYGWTTLWRIGKPPGPGDGLAPRGTAS